MHPTRWIIAAALLAAWTTTALAQPDPKFEFGAPEQVEQVEWKASAQAGLVVTTGNSEARTFSGTAKASRKDDGNRFTAEAGATYVRTTILLAVDEDGDGAIGPGEFDELTNTTTNAWQAKLRYDRFLTENNSLFASALASADEPAGKEFVGGGQLGYMRQLINTDAHVLTAEAGYDYSYQDLSSGDADSIHSLRLFGGYAYKVSEETGLEASLESLMNLNEYTTTAGEVGTLEDTRLNGAASLTTELFEMIDFKFAFKLRYDNAPAPLPPFAIPYLAGFTPEAEKLDTVTEASLIINFL